MSVILTIFKSCSWIKLFISDPYNKHKILFIKYKIDSTSKKLFERVLKSKFDLSHDILYKNLFISVIGFKNLPISDSDSMTDKTSSSKNVTITNSMGFYMAAFLKNIITTHSQYGCKIFILVVLAKNVMPSFFINRPTVNNIPINNFYSLLNYVILAYSNRSCFSFN